MVHFYIIIYMFSQVVSCGAWIAFAFILGGGIFAQVNCKNRDSREGGQSWAVTDILPQSTPFLPLLGDLAGAELLFWPLAVIVAISLRS